VLEGANNGPAVRFGTGEGQDCILAGFVITRGRSQPAAAILCDGASPTITHCLIVGNHAGGANGAAVQCIRSSIAFRNCTLPIVRRSCGAGVVLVGAIQ
jgi:hypothetical protein